MDLARRPVNTGSVGRRCRTCCGTCPGSSSRATARRGRSTSARCPRSSSLPRTEGPALERRLRVALDPYPLFGPRTGVGHYVEQLVAALVALPSGPEVVLATTSLRGDGRAPAPPGVRTRHLRVPFRVVGALQRRLRRPSGESLTGPIDVFHATNFLAPPLRRTPLVVTVHDLAHVRLPETVDRFVGTYRELLPEVLARASGVITPTRCVAEAVAEVYGVPSSILHPIPLGVGDEWFEESHEEPSATNRRRIVADAGEAPIVFVGSSGGRKNLDLLLAAHELAPDLPPLVVAGSVPDRDLPPRVHATGRLGGLPLRSLVAGAACVASPSALEGFGLPILEALATGTPVLASDIPAHREVGGDVVAYAPVPAAPWRPGDDPSFVEAWASGLRRTCGETGRDRTARAAHARRFPWSATAEATAAVYAAVAR